MKYSQDITLVYLFFNQCKKYVTHTQQKLYYLQKCFIDSYHTGMLRQLRVH